MSCALKTSEDDNCDFDATVGSSVTLSIKGMRGSAKIVSATYAGQVLTSPWVFHVLAGKKNLMVGYENTVVGDNTILQEDCNDGTKNTLREFGYDPYGPSQMFCIRGI